MPSDAGTAILQDDGSMTLDEDGNVLLSDGASDCDCCGAVCGCCADTIPTSYVVTIPAGTALLSYWPYPSRWPAQSVTITRYTMFPERPCLYEGIGTGEVRASDGNWYPSPLDATIEFQCPGSQWMLYVAVRAGPFGVGPDAMYLDTNPCAAPNGDYGGGYSIGNPLP